MGNIQATPVEDAALKEIVALEFSRATTTTAAGGGSGGGIVSQQATTGAGVVHSLEGSGRFVKSFRVQHEGHIPLVVKAVQLKINSYNSAADNSNDNDPDHHNSSNNGTRPSSRTGDWCKEQVAELQRIKAAVHAAAVPDDDNNNNNNNLRYCVAPFTYYWIVAATATNNPPLVVGLAVREHVYTTLADRLRCRPWWTMVEKLAATVQLLHAVTALHQYHIYCHGGLSVYNVGLTSLHTVKLLDVGLKRPTGPLSGGMFHAWYKQHRCTVPPERFAAAAVAVTASSASSSAASSLSTTTSSGNNNNNNNNNASINNNHTAIAAGQTTGSIAHHHNNNHQNHQYAAEDCFSVACVITELFTGSSWDLGEILARELPINNIELPAVRACCKHMLGPNRLDDLTAYLDRLVTTTGTDTLHPVLALTRRMEEQVCPDARLALLVQDPYFNNNKKVHDDDKAKKQGIGRDQQEEADDELADLSKSVEAALKDLEQPHHTTTTTAAAVATAHEDTTTTTATSSSSSSVGSHNNPHILYLHLVLATVRHAQRPSSKVRGLKLLRLPHIINATDDETRLQRIVPVAVQLLQDADAAVRAMALTTLTDVVAQCTTFPPSDAQLFPQYILKRVAPLVSDPSWMVRLALAKCLGSLAVTALAFLDVSHAVRLHESTTTNGDMLEGNTFAADLAALQETISRWLLHICTDTSEHATFAKRAVLEHIGALSAFFSTDTLYLLPQVLTFLNERKDWELRAALFEHLPAVCHGRAATEEYVWPCLEIGLADTHHQVVRKSLQCMSRLVEVGLLRATSTTVLGKFFKPYAALVLHHPVRQQALETLATMARVLGEPDGQVYLLPPLDAYLRYHPSSWHVMTSIEELDRIIKKPWSDEKWNKQLQEISRSESNRNSGTWTSVGVVVEQAPVSSKKAAEDDDDTVSTLSDTLEAHVRDYLRMIVRRRNYESTSRTLASGIEGNVKLAQSVLFPRQHGRFPKTWLPEWYANLRDHVEKAEHSQQRISEATAIRSVSSLGRLYGLSIMGPQGSAETIVGVPVDNGDAISFEAQNPVLSKDAEMIESAFAGDWCAESQVPADLLDTCLLVSKIKGLGVPPLAVKLGDAYEKPLAHTGDPQSSSADGKPKIKSLIVTSATSATTNGHTAPVMRLAVSIDQRFFVSGSYDGTCRVWELDSIEESAGLIESAAVYSDHFVDSRAKVNDIAMLEGTHSVVSGDSHGNVHVWRVDLAGPSVPSPRLLDRPRIAGSTTLKRLNLNEGEVIAVSHFNTASSCVATYATQRGGVRSWDLRAAREPFSLRHSPELGLLTSIALGSDRHWIVTGTRCGYVALWDLRYERCVKLWRHSRRAPIARLATSIVPPPQTWGSAPSSMDQARPSIFAATGHNECAMFDVLTGSCKECFRTVDGDNGQLGSSAEEPPKLLEVAIASNSRNGVLTTSSIPHEEFFVSNKKSINCMLGSIGAGHNSYLITGGSDSRIRFWDFTTPSKCYVICGQSSVQPRPTFERVDFDGQRRLMLCRQSHATGSVHQHFHGMRKPDHQHTDSIQDIKIVNSTLISCSRDCTVKIWR